MLMPQDYQPSGTEDFIGDARLCAAFLPKLIAASRAAGRSPIKLLLAGPPGTGKSEIARYLTTLLKVSKWSITKLNGTEVKVDRLDELTSSLQLTDLFGDYRIVQIDEADAIPTVAQVRMLTVLDDLPRGVVVVCTSNSSLNSFEPRFQSRFQFFEFRQVPQLDIEQLITNRWELPVTDARMIALGACGNVRAAMLDTQTWLTNNLCTV